MIILWLGGIRTAWTAVVTVSAIAKLFVYPLRSMAGIMIEPREETSATAEPEMPPKNMLSTQLIIARPPRIRPTKRLARLTSRLGDPAFAHDLAGQDKERDRDQRDRLHAVDHPLGDDHQVDAAVKGR